MDKGILYVMTTAVSGLIKIGKTETEKAYPAPVGMPFVICRYAYKKCGYRMERRSWFHSSPQVGGSCPAALRPLPLPHLTQIYKTFQNLWGRAWGRNAPHTKKGLRFYSKPLNFLGVPKGIFLYVVDR